MSIDIFGTEKCNDILALSIVKTILLKSSKMVKTAVFYEDKMASFFFYLSDSKHFKRYYLFMIVLSYNTQYFIFLLSLVQINQHYMQLAQILCIRQFPVLVLRAGFRF